MTNGHTESVTFSCFLGKCHFAATVSGNFSGKLTLFLKIMGLFRLNIFRNNLKKPFATGTMKIHVLW